jgi:hypothetical protein
MNIEKIDNLKEIAKEMYEKKERIINAYNNLIKTTLDQSNEYLTNKRFNVEEEKIYLKKLFDSFSDNIDNATLQLNEKIIPGYIDYVNKMETLLKRKMSELNNYLDRIKGE